MSISAETRARKGVARINSALARYHAGEITYDEWSDLMFAAWSYIQTSTRADEIACSLLRNA